MALNVVDCLRNYDFLRETYLPQLHRDRPCGVALLLRPPPPHGHLGQEAALGGTNMKSNTSLQM